MSELHRVLGILIAGAIVASGFVVVIHLGYLFNEGSSPPELAAAFPFAVVVLLFAAATLAWWVRRHPRLRAIGRRPLPTGPSRRGAADQARADRIAYADDPMRLATCEHLRPIERAMRTEGVVLSLYHGPVVRADCTIDETTLAARFPLELPVRYVAHVPGDRPGDPGGAMIHCREHSSLIEVIPDGVSPNGAPRWPQA